MQVGLFTKSMPTLTPALAFMLGPIQIVRVTCAILQLSLLALLCPHHSEIHLNDAGL